MPTMNTATRNRFKRGTYAVVFIAAFLVILVLINLLAGALSHAYPVNMDLSSSRLYKTSAAAKKVIKGVDQEVQVYCMADSETMLAGSYSTLQGIADPTTNYTYMHQLDVFLRDLPVLNNKIKMDYVDLEKNPTFASAKLGLAENEVKVGDVVVTGGKGKTNVLSYDKLFNAQQSQVDYGYYIAGSNVESAVCGAILNVTAANTPVITFTTGHSEIDTSYMADFLAKANYEMKTVDLTREEIPAETAFLVMCGPTVDYSGDELKKLDNYLSNADQYGKNFMFFYNYEAPDTTNLQNFLKEWGLAIDTQNVIIESDSTHYLQYPYSVFAEISNNLYAEKMEASKPAIMLPVTLPVKPLWEGEKNSIEPVTLLASTGTANLMPLTADNTWAPDADTPKGSFGEIMMATKTVYDGNNTRSSKIFVCGSANLINQQLISYPSYANSDYFLSILNTETNNEVAAVSIPAKSNNPPPIKISKGVADILGMGVFTLVIPVGLLIVGIVVFARRRFR